jgi:hypothetical protein
MQNLFNTFAGPKVGLVVDPGWRYIRSGLQRNISTAVSYYRSRNFAVKSNHLLVRFLNSAAVSITGDIESFYSQVQSQGIRLTSTFGFSSSVNRGDVFKGTFFGEGSKEIIVACDDYINPVDLEANWEDIEAVKFLDHPKSDLSLLLANGKAYSSEDGYSVIAVNVPALLVQYRCWLKEQKAIYDSDGGPFSTSVFVHKYVLPNMLSSQLDIAIFNRLNNLVEGAPMGVPLYRHAFVLIDYVDKVDKSLVKVKRMLQENDRDFYTMMREVPLVSKQNLLELSVLPENTPTRQEVWTEIIARLKLIMFLFTVNPSHGSKQSRLQINHIKKVYDWFEQANGLEQVPDKELVRDIEAEMIRLRLLCKI